MFEVRETRLFQKWVAKLGDHQAKRAIEVRIDRIKLGNLGDVKPVGAGVSEIRVHCGSGYRVYFTLHGKVVVFLLCGGDKKSQDKDIKTAQAMAANLEV